jgi:hypothetical protein
MACKIPYLGSVKSRISGLLFCLLAAISTVNAVYCPPGPNRLDTDTDGLFDYACIGDWNNNGTCEMIGDIQVALDGLADPGTKFVELSDCSFEPPAFVNGPNSIIRLRDNILIVGRGTDTVLNGFLGTDLTSDESVISNEDHVNGNVNVHIRDLAIDGGWRGGDATGFGHARMGVQLEKCDHCSVQNLTVTDTLHSCLYVKDSLDVDFLDSDLLRCGNYTGEGNTFPCVYLFATDGNELRDVRVAGIECDGSGSNAFNTRRQTTGSTMVDLLFENNIARNTRLDFTGAPKQCFALSGVGSAQLENNTCVNTGGFANIVSDGYYSDGVDVNATGNVTIDGLHLTGSFNRTPVQVRQYSENFTLKNITVEGAAGADCLQFETPVRNFLLDGATLSDCGLRGIGQINDLDSGLAADEALEVRNVDIVGAGIDQPAEGVRFLGAAHGLVLDNVSIDGASSHGLNLIYGVNDSTFSNLSISNTAGIGLRIGYNSSNLLLDLNEISGTGSDCLRLDGFPAPPPNYQNVSITNSTLSACGGRGIATQAGALVFLDLQLSGNVIDGTEGDGIEIDALANGSSAGLSIQNNSIRDFGRDLGGGTYSGIEISGSLNLPIVAQNTIEDLNHQATFGLLHGPSYFDVSALCTNTCSGTLPLTECLHVPGDPSFDIDIDSDLIVNGCDSDDDDDGVLDPADNCPTVFNLAQADLDQDGSGDACDNCVNEFNPSQSDFDMDLEGDVCDLDDGLIYLLFADSDLVSWQPEAGFDLWNFYRGDLELLAAGGIYTQFPGSSTLAARECGLTVHDLPDSVVPDPERVAFYLTSGVSLGVEGGLGLDGLGIPRPNHNPCP